jgi:hypothetical protein
LQFQSRLLYHHSALTGVPNLTETKCPLTFTLFSLQAQLSFPANPLLAPSFAQPPKSALYGQLNLSPEEEEHTIMPECWHLELHMLLEQLW